eukprot:1438184-Amphidinium_carterae.1
MVQRNFPWAKLLQPFLPKPGEFLLTRLVSYIVIEVERTPPRLSSCTHLILKEREITKHAKPDWDLWLESEVAKDAVMFSAVAFCTGVCQQFCGMRVGE